MNIVNSNVNFTGFKNIGGEHGVYYATKMDSKGHTVADLKHSIDDYVVSMELTDDYNGKDLTNFKRAVMKADTENGFNDFNINFLQLHIAKPNTKEFGKFKIFLNDSEVEIKDENLGLLSFIVQMLQRVVDTPKDKLVLDRDFLEDSYEASLMVNSVCMNYPDDIPSREDLTQEDNQKIKSFYDKNSAKEVYNKALDAVMGKMMDYFS